MLAEGHFPADVVGAVIVFHRHTVQSGTSPAGRSAASLMQSSAGQPRQRKRYCLAALERPSRTRCSKHQARRARGSRAAVAAARIKLRRNAALPDARNSLQQTPHRLSRVAAAASPFRSRQHKQHRHDKVTPLTFERSSSPGFTFIIQPAVDVQQRSTAAHVPRQRLFQFSVQHKCQLRTGRQDEAICRSPSALQPRTGRHGAFSPVATGAAGSVAASKQTLREPRKPMRRPAVGKMRLPDRHLR